MRRRRYLAAATGSAVVSVAGCTGDLTGGCSPGDDSIAEIDLDFGGYAESDRQTDETYQVGGTAVDVGPSRVVVDDGTGLAALSVGDREYEFDPTEMAVGDCIAGSGPLRIGRSSQHEVAHVAITTDSFEHGESDRNPAPPPERPDQTVSSDYSGLDEVLTVTVTGEPEIPSDRLLVRWREFESETPWTEADRQWWDELTDVDPGEPIPDGSQFTRDIRSFDYSVCWFSDDRGWSRELDQLMTDDRW